MRFDDLTNEQKVELKQHILMERNEQRGEGTSYGELSDADDLVSDEDAKDWAEGMEFSPDDFSCGVAANRDGVLDEIKEWVERTITSDNYEASLGLKKSDRLEDKCIEWAREQILQHIDAVRE